MATKKIRKWSAKYKKSINCNKPKGFSQKQHCKYGKNKQKSFNIKGFQKGGLFSKKHEVNTTRSKYEILQELKNNVTTEDYDSIVKDGVLDHIQLYNVYVKLRKQFDEMPGNRVGKKRDIQYNGNALYRILHLNLAQVIADSIDSNEAQAKKLIEDKNIETNSLIAKKLELSATNYTNKAFHERIILECTFSSTNSRKKWLNAQKLKNNNEKYSRSIRGRMFGKKTNAPNVPKPRNSRFLLSEYRETLLGPDVTPPYTNQTLAENHPVINESVTTAELEPLEIHQNSDSKQNENLLGYKRKQTTV